MPYLGRILAGRPTWPSIDVQDLLQKVCEWLEDDAMSVASAAKRLREVADEWRKEGEELSGDDYKVQDDPVWMAGLHLGQAEVLEALAKQVSIPERPGPEIDLIIIEHRHEVWIDLPDMPAPRLLEDKRDGQDFRAHTRPDVEPTSARETKPKRKQVHDPEAAFATAVELRKAEGLSMPAIAKRIGLSVAQLSTYFRDRGVKLSDFGPSAYRLAQRPKQDAAELVRQAVELKQANPDLSHRQLAERLGVPPGTLSHHLSKAGVRFRDPDAPVRKYDREKIVEEAIQLRREEGLAQWQVAQRLGIPQGSLSMMLSAAGVAWGEIKPTPASEDAAPRPPPEPAAVTTGPRPPPEPAAVTTGPQAPKVAPKPKLEFESDARPFHVKLADREKILSRVLERAPPAEPHVAVLDPSGNPIRYVLVGADGDSARTLRAAMEWVETFVTAGARPAGEYVFKRPGVKTPVRQVFPRVREEIIG